jgi:hypothetical protein
MLKTLRVPVGDLVADARSEAEALGDQWLGTEHLLVAMLRQNLGLCSDLLLAEGMEVDALLAEIVVDSDSTKTGLGSDEEPEPTQRLREVLCVAHEHAVLLESEQISADHALLAIVVSGKGYAADTLANHGDGCRERVREALVSALAPEGAPSMPLAITTRESIAVAWSLSLALGREEIEIADLLRGICAPRWTIGARAIANLGPIPDWAPALWTGEAGEDPYRRIRFDEAAAEALRMAAEEAAALGRDHIGTEHLLLGISRAAIEELGAFVGRKVSLEAVREAIVRAVTSGEEAREAESQRRGWRAEQDAEPTLVERAIAGAREMATTTGGGEPGGDPQPGCWDGFVAAILLNEDEDLAELLEELTLDPSEIRRLAEGESDLPFGDAIALAEERQRDAELQPLDLMLAAVAVRSPRLLAALDSHGLTASEVRAQLSEWRLRQEGDTSGVRSVLAASGLNLLFGAFASAALLQVVLQQGEWWKLAFLPLIWSGYPGFGPIGGTFVAGLLAFAVSPLVGILHLLGIPFDIVQARAERQMIWARTGVRLNLRELRCVTRRNLGSMGQINQDMRQILRSTLPAWIRRGARR